MRIETKKLHKDLASRIKINRVQIIGNILVATLCCLMVFCDLHFSGILGQSMFPALRSGGTVVEVAPTNIQRGDIVTAYLNDGMIVKRLIGLPGETIRFSRNQIFINDYPIYEYYIVHEQHYTVNEFKIGLDEVFIMGDNRAVSDDSRFFGPVKLSTIDSKVIWNLKW